MAFPDPFAGAQAAPQQEAQPEPPQQSPWDSAPAPAPEPAAAAYASVGEPPADDSEKVRITLKSGGGYDAPWLTADFPNIATAAERLKSAETQDNLLQIFSVVGQASSLFSQAVGGGQSSPQQGGGGQQRQSRAPQQAQEAPNGEKRYCKHGEMVYKSGISQKGNAYALFSCTGPRGDQCPAQYPSKRGG
ncbi:hypothetical protein SEA_SHAM4_50 [Mycobacterium phage Sham4]|nr:hypothetical protein SEA_SHAM4_50 [Mycobacterium phage Sham4]